MAAKQRKDLDIKTKVKILQEVDKKELNKTQIALKYKIPKSTLSTILKNRTKIEHSIQAGSSSARKRLRPAKHEEVEEQLFDFFSQARAAKIPVSGPILTAKADELALRAGLDDFKCSQGWLWRFQKRYNIVSLAICGEAERVNEDDVQEWLESVRPILDEYSAKDIFNMDETGVYYNTLPDRTLAIKGEKCHGGKKSKERVTVLLCCNLDGSEKLKPLVIGKFENPRCFKGIDKSLLPCSYRNSKNAWVTGYLFREWLMILQRKMACRNRNILLMMDRCGAHGLNDLQTPNVRIMMLPANTTSRIQPLDQGIIQNVKKFYRARLNHSYIRQLGSGKPVDAIQKWTVLDALRTISVAWNQVTPKTITNCFRKGGFTKGEDMEVDSDTDIDPDIEIEVDMTPWGGVTFAEYVDIDRDLATSAVITSDAGAGQGQEDALGDETTADNTTSVISDDEEDDVPAPVRPNKAAMCSALSTVEAYISTTDVSPQFIAAFDLMSKEIAAKQNNAVIQKKINDFFKK